MKNHLQILSIKKLKPLKIIINTKIYLYFLLFIGLSACQNNKPTESTNSASKDSIAVVQTDTVAVTPVSEVSYALALSPNALQLVNQNTGATTEMSFGMQFDDAVETLEKVLKLKPSVGINSECGAGPLKMATWDNGLTLLFKEKNKEWLFEGWAANKAKNPEMKLTNMAGVGIGSTRKDMESATVIEVEKTSLGYEFSTKSDDLFGIFDGAGENAKITALWSGISCNFR
ncbi:hypothetical protein A5893_15660 [Pedobacter psychrophilus]|uniref:Uncharacterized protein n=1 Tax=Pedobacter psychrophilus TaxID=1826909 RepID=A0A179DBS4_9SPHI|nr:hypothetical protein [Pedobacter psychrophilus]OAQ38232.1 hypothetical protein A5893_15660 [Pedobacter psychrophilus]